MKRWSLAVCAFIMALFLAVPAWAEDKDPSSLCPENALLFVKSAPISKVKEDLDAFGNRALPMVYGMAAQQVEEFLSGPIGQALDQEKGFGLALVMPAGAPTAGEAKPVPFFFLPAKNFAALQKAIQDETPGTQMKQVGSYAVGCDNAEALKMYKAGKAPAFALKGSLQISVNVPLFRQLWKTHGAEWVREAVQGALQSPLGAALKEVDEKALSDSLLKFVELLGFQADQAEACLTVEEKGLRLEWQAAPRAGTALDRFAKDQSGLSSSKDLVAAGATPNSWMVLDGSANLSRLGAQIETWVLRFSKAAGVKEEAQKDMSKWAKASLGIRAFTVSACPSPKEGDPMEAVEIDRLADPKKGMAELEAYWMSPHGRSLDAAIEWKVKRDAFKHGGVAVHTAQGTVAKSDDPQKDAMNARLIGQNPMAAFCQVNDAAVVAWGPSSQERIKETIDRLQAKPPKPAALPKWHTRLEQDLPKDAQARVAVSLADFVQMMAGAMAQATGGGPNPAGKMKVGPTGIGGFARSSSSAVGGGVVLPSESIANVSGLVMQMVAQGMGGGGGGREMPPEEFK